MASRRENIVDRGKSLILSQSLIHSINECLVLLDRPAKRPAEVIAAKFRKAMPVAAGRRVEKICRVQSAIAQVLKDISVKLVGAAFAHHDDLTAHRHPVFGTECV